MEKKLILLVDDEPRRMLAYKTDLDTELPPHFEVVLAQTPEDALKRWQADHGRIACVLLDVMMPHGTAFTAEETSGSIRTGLRLYRSMRALEKERGARVTPVVLLTNVKLGDEELAQLGHRVTCLWKPDALPPEVTDLVLRLCSAAS